ncbi:MAG: hypothetical protein JW904_07795 [Spirochaetales bacterium]|nr:hypothetical protein [Spirochaetales bacterium]
MKRCTCLLFETGFEKGIPGYTTDVPSGSFPFWGNFFFADVLVSNLVGLTEKQPLYFFTPEPHFTELQKTIHRWKVKNNVELLMNHEDRNGFISWIKQMKSDIFIIGGTAHAFLFKKNQLQSMLKKQHADLARISVEMTPLDMFVVTRKKLLAIAQKSETVQDTEKTFQQILFKHLSTEFETIEDVPGRVFFHRHSIDLYSAHKFLLEAADSGEYNQIAEQFSFLASPHAESYIGETGEVKNAFIAAGAEIYGTVINSVIFPGVVIAKGAVVENSVVMSNNKIGPDTKIENAVLFPYAKGSFSESYNIRNNARIGSLSKKTANTKYPMDIYDGVTVLGLNPQIPEGTVIDAACYIGPNLSMEAFSRYNKVVKKGMCIET